MILFLYHLLVYYGILYPLLQKRHSYLPVFLDDLRVMFYTDWISYKNGYVDWIHFFALTRSLSQWQL